MRALSEICYYLNYASFADLYKHLKECDLYFIPPLSQRADIHAYANKIRLHGVTLEAWHKEVLVGLLAFYKDNENKVAFITNVSILPGYHGKGIARNLLTEFQKFALTNKLIETRLQVNKNNISALQLYLSVGFFNETVEDDQVFMKFIIKGVI